MKTKKLVALLLAAAMSLGCLGGCGTKESSTSESKASEVKQESTEAPSESKETVVELEEKTIQVWMIGPGKQKDSDKVWEAFNEMLQEYVPNTTVEFTIIPNAEYNDAYSRMLAAGEEVDLAWVGWLTKTSQNIKDGNLMPLDDLLEEYGQGIIETLGQDVMDMHTVGGQTYYVINWQGLIGHKTAYYMPTELVELAGDGWLEKTQEVVSKWWNEDISVENYSAVFDQFDIYLAACKEAGKLYSGLHPNYDFNYSHGRSGTRRANTFVNQIGVERTYDGKLTVIDSVQSEIRRVYAQRMAEFYEKGYLRSDIASVDLSTLKFVTNGEYNDNTVVLYAGNILTDTAKETTEKKAGVELSFIDREPVATVIRGSDTAMSIPYCADDPERAMMVLNALYTVPELYQLLIYGIEGEHYTKNADGTIVTSYGAEGTSDADYGLVRWTIGSCLNSLVTQNDSPNYYPDLKAEQDKALLNPFINFSFDKTNVQDICTALSAIDSIYEKMVDKCAAGADMEEKLDEWIKERKAAGVDKVVEEYQRQLDEYVKENNITSW